MPNRTSTFVVRHACAPRERKAQKIIEVVTRSRPRLRFFGQTLSLPPGQRKDTQDTFGQTILRQVWTTCLCRFLVRFARRKKCVENHRSGDKVAASFALLWSDTLSPAWTAERHTGHVWTNDTQAGLDNLPVSFLVRFARCHARAATRGPQREGRNARAATRGPQRLRFLRECFSRKHEANGFQNNAGISDRARRLIALLPVGNSE